MRNATRLLEKRPSRNVDEKSATRSNGNGRRRLRFDADVVVDSSANPLLAAEIAFGCLHGDVAEKELNLFQRSTRSVAQLGARTPQIMRRYMGEPEFSSILFHHMPDDSFRYTLTPAFACATDTSEESPG